jgi:predicted metalloprotease
MRWTGRRESTQVEDRRGMGMPRGGRGVAVGGIGTLLAVLGIAWLTGVSPLALLALLEGGGSVAVDTTPGLPGAPVESSPEEERRVSFVKVILGDTEETWTELFTARGRRYALPKLVLFRDAVQSACGFGSAAVGPFYCPGDARVYLDLTFFDELDRRFGAPGDFAQAYVIAHEVGHHVQSLLGIAERIDGLRRRARSEAEANELSVRMELQADCLAGVWGHHANTRRRMLEPGDVEEGLGAAAAIGDDRIQRMSRGAVAPESWTHGSSAMRVQWLRRGLESGDPGACDTFASAAAPDAG